MDFTTDPASAREDSNLYALMFLILGVAYFITEIISYTIFNSIGEELTEKIRNEAYLKILKMPIKWFDNPRNSAGSLSAKLGSDSRLVNSLVTTYVKIVIQNLATLASSIGIAFYYDWRTTLVSLGLFPFIVLGGVIEMTMASGFSAKSDAIYKGSSSLIT